MNGETLAQRQSGLLDRLRFKARTGEAIVGWLFVLPVVVATLVFDVLPMIPAAFFSLHAWDAFTPMRWIGLGNYAALLGDAVFLDSVQNTAIYVIGSVPLSILAGFLLALLINQKIPGVTVFRGIFYLPVIASTVAAGIVFQFLLSPQFGLLNSFLYSAFGIAGPAWLLVRPWAMIWLIIFSIWISMGYYMVMFLAGLQGIPVQLYEAATIDGASSWQKLRYVTLPLVSSTFFFALVIAIFIAVNAFTLVYVLTEASRWGNTSAYNGTRLVVIYVYGEALQRFRLGLGSAVAMFMFIVVGLLTLVNFKLNQRWVFYS